jgi:hypothetical protein
VKYRYAGLRAIPHSQSPEAVEIPFLVAPTNRLKNGSSVLIVLIFQENAKEVMPVFQNLLNFSNQSHTFLIALI